MTTAPQLRQHLRDLLRDERGTILREAPNRFALLYPSPYRAGMSSLGFQILYCILNQRDDTACERAFLPDDPVAWRQARLPVLSIETQTPLRDFDLIGVSLAYELEIPGLLECLDLSGIPLRARDRRAGRDPLVVLGGPLTFSNPLPAAPFADIVIMGEAEEAIQTLMDVYEDSQDRDEILVRLSALPGFHVPAIHGERLVPVVAANNVLLPGVGQIRTPHTELANMHLVESERGCHRKCTFCVMRRSTNGGMRLADPQAILDSIPEDAQRVGLVGAAVSDHPKLIDIVRSIVDGGRGIGLSSLRADRLSPTLVELLRRGGYRTLTVASDGASERLRAEMEKGTKESHLLEAAHLSARFGLRTLKVYMMVGVPGETDEDIDELIAFCRTAAGIGPLALGVAPFVSKRNTPLDRRSFAGIREVERTMDRLTRALRGTVDIRSTSARWAWVEWNLAQGGFDMTEACVDAWQQGNTFHAWKQAIARHRRPDSAPADAAE
jgi:radical SAM superfamily enzyme YgiQ (UPF0313 family)